MLQKRPISSIGVLLYIIHHYTILWCTMHTVKLGLTDAGCFKFPGAERDPRKEWGIGNLDGTRTHWIRQASGLWIWLIWYWRRLCVYTHIYIYNLIYIYIYIIHIFIQHANVCDALAYVHKEQTICVYIYIRFIYTCSSEDTFVYVHDTSTQRSSTWYTKYIIIYIHMYDWIVTTISTKDVRQCWYIE